MFKFTENVYESNLPIRYVLEEGANNKDYMVVVFSGFNPPNAKLANSYNYMRTLKDVDCHRLFILDDYGPRGSYYLGSKEAYEVEASIASLISYIARKYGVKQENVITAGSSKGGSAALYYGLKYNYGHVVAGAPQTRIADYVQRNTKETFEYMLGDNPNEGEIKKLNQIIFKQLHEKSLTKLQLLTSENDIQYKRHIEPFVKELDKLGMNYQLTVNNQIENHNAIAVHFPLYLMTHLSNIIYGINIKNLQLNKQTSSSWNLLVDYELKDQNKSTLMKIVVKNQDELITEVPVKDETYFDIKELNIKGSKVLDIFFVIEIDGKSILHIPMDSLFMSHGAVLEGTELSIKDDHIHFKINIEDSPNIEYAFYIRRNNVVIDKLMYQDSQELIYPLKDKGKYQVHYFIRTSDGEKYSNRTKAISYD
ncbi:MAG: accessory Sec system protein Asp2 [Bacillota bacterium]